VTGAVNTRAAGTDPAELIIGSIRAMKRRSRAQKSSKILRKTVRSLQILRKAAQSRLILRKEARSRQRILLTQIPVTLRSRPKRRRLKG